MQGFGMWGVDTMTILGNYGGTELDNIYMEEGSGPCTNPYLGSSFGATGIILSGQCTASDGTRRRTAGGARSFGLLQRNSGSTQLNYFVVAHDTTAGIYSAPLFAGVTYTQRWSGQCAGAMAAHPSAESPGYGSLRHHSDANVTSLSANAPSFPVKGSCTEEVLTACGSVATSSGGSARVWFALTPDAGGSNTASYAIQALSWEPILPFWPGSVVFSGDGSAAILSRLPPSTWNRGT